MQNDMNYMNTYVEVLNDNLTSIIKQNIVLQTNLQIAEHNLKLKDDAERQVSELKDINRNLQNRVNELESLTSSYKTVADDKGRLQVALNENSQEKNKLQETVNSLQQELMRANNKIEQFKNLEKELIQKTNELERLKTTKETTKVDEKPAEVDNKKDVKTVKKSEPVLKQPVNIKASAGTF